MKLLVIDGNSIVNRAFFGMHPLNNKEGFPTHAIFGFLNILRRMERELEPDGICVTFDRREPTFRHLAYEGYKAQRKGMPEDLAVQMPVLKEVLDALNIPRYELAGWEADDLIGTITRQCEQAGWDCRVATGDRDALQLVSDQTYVELVTTRMGQTTTQEMDPAAFREKYGFAPAQMVDLKALMGDASDNVPGVPGVGKDRPGPPPGQRHLSGGLRPPGPGDPGDPAGDEEAAGGRTGRAPSSPTTCAPSGGMPPWTSPRRRRCGNRPTPPCCWSCSRNWTSKNSSPRWGWRPRAPARPTSPAPPPKRWCG